MKEIKYKWYGLIILPSLPFTVILQRLFGDLKNMTKTKERVSMCSAAFIDVKRIYD